LNLYHVDASHHLEHLAGNMGRGSVAGRPDVELTRIGLGVGYQLGNGFGRNRGMNHHDKRRVAGARDRRDVTDEIEIELFEHRRIDRVWRRAMRSV
jgi:hypothetical protein